MSDATGTLSGEKLEAFEKIKALLEQQEVPGAAEATPESTWEQLDADSLDLVELVRALEDEYGLSIDDKELDGVNTVGDAAEMLVRVQGEQGSG
jgi:acyl carrier protein